MVVCGAAPGQRRCRSAAVSTGSGERYLGTPRQLARARNAPLAAAGSRDGFWVPERAGFHHDRRLKAGRFDAGGTR
jgi:hypothetical protein